MRRKICGSIVWDMERKSACEAALRLAIQERRGGVDPGPQDLVNSDYRPADLDRALDLCRFHPAWSEEQP